MKPHAMNLNNLNKFLNYSVLHKPVPLNILNCKELNSKLPYLNVIKDGEARSLDNMCLLIPFCQ